MANPLEPGILDLTEAMLAKDPPDAPRPQTRYGPYVHRELKIVTTRTGGYGLIIDQDLIGVAESAGRLQTLVSDWVKGF